MENIKIRVIDIMEQNGIFYEEEDDEDSAFEMDSLTFMSIIIDIEEAFEIKIPEEVLGIDYKKYSDFVEKICFSICGNKQSSERAS